MAYIKINWTEKTPLNAVNLNRMEAQYDEVMASLGDIRKAETELIIQIVTSDPTPVVGHMIFNSTEKAFKYATNTGWRPLAMAGGVDL